jgi:hypothetical protein
MDVRAGGWLDGRHFCCMWDHCCRWLCACQDPAINGHDWTTGRAAGAEDPSHAPGGGLTWLGVR